MADPYRIVIGLEVHVQLLTQSKLFCGCSTKFGLPPNSATCPVCLGMPGVLPVMNRRAFNLALKAALALNCQIATFTKWDRKNYYYPDLPKNYQISQYDLPFSRKGWLDIEIPNAGETDAPTKRIGIIRVHLEEDAGKLLHEESGDGKGSLVDLNRTGTPLLEIVSEPDLSTPEEAKTYLEEIRLMMRDLEVSDCEMQEGSLRCDANVNLHIPLADGDIAATPIVEVKNLNSFRAVERALKFEAQRQYDEFQRTGVTLGKGEKTTAGWNEEKGVTVVQRRKEEEADYRYFPEPDLTPVIVDSDWIDGIRREMGELPAAARSRLRSQYDLSAYDSRVISDQGRAFVQYFDRLAQLCGDAKEAANWMTNQVLAYLNEHRIGIGEFPLETERVAQLVCEVRESGLNHRRAREVFARMTETGETVKDALEALGIKVIADEQQLREIVQQAIAGNAKAASDYKKGKGKAADAIKGAIMRQTKGMAKIELVQRLLHEELEKI